MKKVMFATDLHGSYYYGKKIVDAFLHEKADLLVLLGDIYYHGPRNPLPDGHSPMELCALLNGIKDKVVSVRGNCDADIDVAISEFPFIFPETVVVGNKKVFVMHGYENVTVPDDVDIVLRGHFHVNSSTIEDNKRVFGLSSPSLPKEGAERCYAVVENGILTYKSVEDRSTYNTVKI